MFLRSYCWVFSVAASLLLMKGLLSLGLLSPGRNKHTSTFRVVWNKAEDKEHVRGEDNAQVRQKIPDVKGILFATTKSNNF